MTAEGKLKKLRAKDGWQRSTYIAKDDTGRVLLRPEEIDLIVNLVVERIGNAFPYSKLESIYNRYVEKE